MYRTCVTKLQLILTVFAFSILPALAQEEHAHHANHGLVGWVPRELLERPTPLRDGIGKSQVAVTGSPKGQAFYNQGVAYLHG